VPKGGLEPPRVTSHAPQTCASTSSATSARLGKTSKIKALHFFAGEGEVLAPGCVAAGVAAAGVACGVGVGVGVGVAAGACSGIPDCNTEVVPLMNGRDKHNANNMKPAAAPIVSLDSNVCVPRGPKAVLDTELENNAPASALPGCSSTAMIRMTHERMNNP
jgi:hypothetical protein